MDNNYNNSALLTDAYQLTMAFAYFKEGLHQRQACFQLFFRHPPFGGSYAIACGLEDVIDYIENFSFTNEDTKYLSSLKSPNGANLFSSDFIDYLRDLKFSCSIEALEEGELVFPLQPIIKITGPILQCQILETPILNLINFQTLIATKASRIKLAAKNKEVIEFGLRRAQGFNGAMSASRAAFVGGCESTSNLLAGKSYDIKVQGTLAHSWIMMFKSELEAFAAYAKALPDNVVLLVDTYDTATGVKNAVSIGKRLKQLGKKLLAIRLDSGDLLELSKIARQILDDAGFVDCKIIASNDLDEYKIDYLIKNNACIDIWGVGTKLVTAFDCPFLGGVYKLVAIKEGENHWRGCQKTTNDKTKATLSGKLNIKRYVNNDQFIGDIIYNDDVEITNPLSSNCREMLVKIYERGKLIYQNNS